MRNHKRPKNLDQLLFMVSSILSTNSFSEQPHLVQQKIKSFEFHLAKKLQNKLSEKETN